MARVKSTTKPAGRVQEASPRPEPWTAEQALQRLAAYQVCIEDLQRRADQVAGVLRLDMGVSWQRIADALGMTQQGALHRYTNPRAAGYREWAALGWVDAPSHLVPVPDPEPDPADAAVFGLREGDDDSPVWDEWAAEREGVK